MKLFLKFSTFLVVAGALSLSFVASNNIDEQIDPILYILGKTHTDNSISMEALENLDKIDIDESYAQRGFTMGSFSLVYVKKGKIIEMNGEDGIFSNEMKEVLQSLKLGETFTVERIQMYHPTGQIQKMPSFSFKIE